MKHLFFQACKTVILTTTTLISATTQAAPSTPPSARATGGQPQASALPHVTIDLAQHHVDLDATVVLRQGGWLELLACTPQTRTHESILVVHAKPSHVHLAMKLLGLEPGAPRRWRLVEGEYQAQPAHGPKVAVDILWQPADGGPVTVGAHQWIIDRTTGDVLKDNIWIFTGSSFDESRDPPVYRADVEGSVLSLVHFGDEVLARDTHQTNQTDGKAIGPNTDQIPGVGTRVKIRLRPLPKPDERSP